MIQVFKPSMGKAEIDAVAKVLKSGWIGLGPVTERFEKRLEKYLNKKYIITTNSATASLHLALIAAGVKEGSEVISPAFTFVSTNHAILYQRAIPVFCDIDRKTLCADPLDISKKITSKTKAIIVVHFGGHAVDMDEIMRIAKKQKIAVIEDAAHAFGGLYKGKMLGTIGDFGCYSFHAVKSIAMGDGGAIFTKSKTYAQKLKELRWMGINKNTWQRTDKKKYSWEYDVIEIGYKYHTNDILSSIGIVQLEKFPKVILRKREIWNRYHDGLNNLSWLTLPVEKQYAKSGMHNYCVQLGKRDLLSEYLKSKGIATTVHYVPNNYYRMYKAFKADIPITKKIWKKVLLLPFYPDLSNKEVDYIIESIRSFKP